MKSRVIVTEKNAIFYILLLGAALRAVVLLTTGENMYLYSDDVNYLYTVINFMKSGYITYTDYNYPTVFAMPGLIMFLASVFSVFGHGETGIFIARLLFNCMGILTIYGVYLCADIIGKSKEVSNWAALFTAVCVPFIAMNNIFLTETPGLCALIFLTYYLLKFSEDLSDKTFAMLLIVYLCCVLIKPVYGVYPVGFLPVFLYNKISWKELLKRGTLALIALFLCLSPWVIRNFMVTGEFIPLTGNQGDTLLLGSYDGENVPAGTYDEGVELAAKRAAEQGKDHPYFEWKERGILGRERINQWKETDPAGYIKATYITKPLSLMKLLYYPIPVFDIGISFLYFFFKLQLGLSAAALLGMIVTSKRNAQRCIYSLAFLLGIILILYINARYAAISRYAMPNMFLAHIFSAFGIYFIFRAASLIAHKFGVRENKKDCHHPGI